MDGQRTAGKQGWTPPMFLTFFQTPGTLMRISEYLKSLQFRVSILLCRLEQEAPDLATKPRQLYTEKPT